MAAGNAEARARLEAGILGEMALFSRCFGLHLIALLPQIRRMQSHELLREVIQTTSAKQVSSDLNLSLSMIYKWAEPDEGDGSGAVNPLGSDRAVDPEHERSAAGAVDLRAGGWVLSS
jgi:hypothetical protein